MVLGENIFNGFMKSMRSPVIGIVEMVLFAGALFHILNGIRILCVNAGYWIDDQLDMAYVVLVVLFLIFLFHGVPILEQFAGIIF
jgi:succinate dehydrogenase/fumarate reductase cytochrome b subunit